MSNVYTLVGNPAVSVHYQDLETVNAYLYKCFMRYDHESYAEDERYQPFQVWERLQEITGLPLTVDHVTCAWTYDAKGVEEFDKGKKKLRDISRYFFTLIKFKALDGVYINYICKSMKSCRMGKMVSIRIVDENNDTTMLDGVIPSICTTSTGLFGTNLITKYRVGDDLVDHYPDGYEMWGHYEGKMNFARGTHSAGDLVARLEEAGYYDCDDLEAKDFIWNMMVGE